MPRSPDDELSPDVQALLDSGRPLVPISDTARARAVARARTWLAGPPVAPALALRPPATWHRSRWAAAAAIALVAGVAGGAAAYELRHHAPPSGPAALPPAPAPRRIPKPSEVIVLPEVPPSAEAPTPALAPPSRARMVREELQLLQRARAAMARRDFAAALAPLAEHARRFREGRLAEEREALRVKALSGLGRTREARRVFTAFAARFPRSPLLPALSRMAEETP